MRDIARILVVEDERILQKSLVRTLTVLGYTTHTADTVQEAQAFLAANAVDLVLSDYQLGDGTAHDVLQTVLSCTPIPLVIIMSGLALKREAFVMGKIGVAEFLEKPFSDADLRRALEEARQYRFPVSLMAASSVGNESVRKLAGNIRDTMTVQAMAMAAGNRTRAARYLKIQRQSLGDK